MLIPIQVDVPMARLPVVNFALIAVIAVASLAAMVNPTTALVHSMILDGWNPAGIFGHVFLHGGIVHLVGNLLFLWVFGNAVCAKLGNALYAGLFFAFAVIAAMAHLLFDGDPAIGASGAINGVVGAYLVLYPLNDVRCFYLLFFQPGTFALSSVWMIMIWLAFDLYGALTGGRGVAYWAHLGGFAAGFGLASLLLSTRVVTMLRNERSFWQAVRA